MQKRFTLLLVLVLIINVLAISPALPSINTFSNQYEDLQTIVCSYSFEKPTIPNNTDNVDVIKSISIFNLSSQITPGYPTIPVKKISILLPPNHRFKQIQTSSECLSIQLEKPLMINNPHNIAGNDLYPLKTVEVINTFSSHGYSILMIKLYPIQVNFQKNEIVYNENISFTIETEPWNQDHELYRDYAEDKQLISEMIENPSMIPYYSNMIQTNKADETDVKYVVITNSELEPYFNPLITYKNIYLTAKTVNLTYIINDFNGQDLQEKIREFIRYAYSNWHTEFILLGGDVDIIPYRGLHGHAKDHEGTVIHDDNIPADIYYAGLDGSWDSDGDRIFGEDWENSTADEADFLTEVYVGRAPVSSNTEVGTFINKIISFETSEKPKKVQLHQSGINNRNDPDSTVIPESCAQWIPSDYQVNKLYEINQEITLDDWMNCFAQNNLIIQHTGNGQVDQYFIDWPTTILSNIQSLSVLSNDFYPIHTSVACHSGAFDYNDCIAESLILNPYGGASACIFNSRWGFTSSSNAQKYSGEFIEQQFYQTFSGNANNLGKIHQFAKQHFTMDAFIDSAYRWCYYTLNLLGDPETPVLVARQEQYSSSNIIVDDDFNENTNGWNTTNFNSIQNGINAASDWDTIYVKNGNYNERLIIKKTLQILGEDRQKTILNGEKGQGKIQIKADRVRLQGFTIKNDGLYLDLARIEVTESNYVTIADCVINDNIYAIWANEANNLFIINNEFKNNLRSIYSNVKAGSIYVYDNLFVLNKENSYGIYSKANARHIIQNNTFSSELNFYNFSCGIYLNGNSEISSNKINQCSIGIWLTQGNHIISKNMIMKNKHIGIYASSSSTTISYNTVSENGNNWISYDNDFEPGGIIINGTSNMYSNITHNKIFDNNGVGIFIRGLIGLENSISYNDFIDNSLDARYRNSFCYWHHNFWNKQRFIPKVIFGGLETNSPLIIPLFQLDLHPASLLINEF